ncbi:LytR/AlgR family response regulator transcription factor [Autumnicola musiva]|uniref:LytTR family DNA-binding domain-containing protein n=1 Tax=Autumnicola musiva TaxID=3075589 RepID=A0ABU3D4C6_9FLAO|nr:LytTR family DNA-binding domain-containing protein [Zunongwangia sp. F117]MDT0675888.1 LytTR family DNA-binding domain-containing protein [Zunongwangia sp. F117]
MKKIILIDDEMQSIGVLQNLLKEYKGFKVCATAQTLDEAFIAIKEHQPDIVLLDVQLNEQSSFELLDRIKEINFDIIFTTGYHKHSEHAVKAFRYNAIDYLLKPIDREQLSESFSRTSRHQDSLKFFLQKLNTLKTNFFGENLIRQKLAVPTTDGFLLAEINEITKCESDSNYTHIYFSNGYKIITTKTLKHIEKLLTDQPFFFRVHQSFLINLQYASRYYKGKGGYIELKDGSTVPVAVRKKERLIRTLTGN